MCRELARDNPRKQCVPQRHKSVALAIIASNPLEERFDASGEGGHNITWRKNDRRGRHGFGTNRRVGPAICEKRQGGDVVRRTSRQVYELPILLLSRPQDSESGAPGKAVVRDEGVRSIPGTDGADDGIATPQYSLGSAWRVCATVNDPCLDPAP